MIIPSPPGSRETKLVSATDISVPLQLKITIALWTMGKTSCIKRRTWTKTRNKTRTRNRNRKRNSRNRKRNRNNKKINGRVQRAIADGRRAMGKMEKTTENNFFSKNMYNMHGLKITRGQVYFHSKLGEPERDVRLHSTFIFSVWIWQDKTLLKGTALLNSRKVEQLLDVTKEFQFHAGIEMGNGFTSIVQIQFLS